MDRRVSEYIKKQDKLKKSILKKSRKLILDTIHNCDEVFKWGVPVYDGGKLYLGAVKYGVNIGFAIKGLSKKDIGEFDGAGKTMRHIKIQSLEEYNPKQLKRLIKLVHKNAVCPPDYK